MRQIGIEGTFYPVGGAANHGLLYLLLRAIRELDVACVLEFGAGQTTLLLHAVRTSLRPELDVTTVEHDAGWAGHVQNRVSHTVLHAPLASTMADGKPIEYYSGDL